jgi:hypothetical protein
VVSKPYIITEVKFQDDHTDDKFQIHKATENRTWNSNNIDDRVFKIKEFQPVRFYWVNRGGE